MDEEVTPVDSTPEETRAEMLRLSARGYTQLRHVLVQLPDTEGLRESTLARVVRGRKHRALVLYLLVLACWPWLEKSREPLAAAVWVRALSADKGLTWSASTLSRAWRDLEEMGLIERTREDRSVRVVPRREDGGAAYEAPGGRKDRWNAYFSLPDAFWEEEWFARLSLPALVMLLVVAKETNGKSKEVWLTYAKTEPWYGIKDQTAQKGLKELEVRGLLRRRMEKIKAPLSPTGHTVRNWYSLTGDFGREARQAMQKRAATEQKKRLGGPVGTDSTTPRTDKATS
ncbi:hypothetical protein RB202_12205 [Micrococcus yunnanensis]|uniref:ArsR family transcriptional regulator n=1 Tax=Micrococcus yunnanensis TaxID=566027 RepID=UPI00178C1669|nr:ArsR family transcriptional regulator [Micrococcus yunnanensis]MBE1538109.1 DNA-binding HxlR family transcriptional regulator [Micrococcus yunnanensis]